MQRSQEIHVFIFLTFLSFFALNFNLQTTFATNYFSTVLSGIVGTGNTGISNFGNIFSPILNISNFGSGLFGTHSSNQNVLQINTEANVVKTNNSDSQKIPDNPYIFTSQNQYLKNQDTSTGAAFANTNATKTASTTAEKVNNYLAAILQKLGLGGTNSNTTNPVTALQNTQPTQTPSQTTNGNNPNLNNPINANTQNPFLQRDAFGNPTQPSALDKYLPTSPASAPSTLATPYKGPGGTLPGDCGMPVGPVAYNIGGNNGDGVKCNTKTIFVGRNQSLKSGVFGGGYVNPMLEKGESADGASQSNCIGNTAAEYGEKCYKDYSQNSSGGAYVQKQILHWKAEGARLGQSCVPIELDNCDSIGADKYKMILDIIEQLNQGGVKIKVININPHIDNCNFLSHPAVIGAVTESMRPEEVKKVSQMRNNPAQILLVLRGGNGTNGQLKQIESLKIPNSAYSYDTGSEYQTISDCTYNP